MSTRKRKSAPKKMYRLIKKVRLENGHSSVILDETTGQDVLEEYFNTEVGNGFIELVATPGVAAQTQDHAEAGQ